MDRQGILALCSAVLQLLMKDPSKRLGSNGATEVQQYPLFRSIDWKRLEAGKVKPLFEPDVSMQFLLSAVVLGPDLLNILRFVPRLKIKD